MTAKVMQGLFPRGQPRLAASLQPKMTAPPPIQAKTAMRSPGRPAPTVFGRPPGPPAPAFGDRPPGPPPPAFAGRHGAVQRHGAGGAFAVEAGQFGLASGGGRPLPEAVRGKMEAALSADFSNVRVHVGPQAERIGAIAFTVGSDIYFAPGRYQPGSVHGQQLLGHELAHVVQQRTGRVRNPLGFGLAVVQDHALEAEAERLGRHAAAHRVAAQAKMPGTAQLSAPVRMSPPIGTGPGSYRLTAGAGGSAVGSVMVHARDKGAVEVTDLHVAEAQRGHGIGRMLLASAARTGQQFGKSKVTLAAQDKGRGHLTRWYREMGFTQTGVNQRGFPQLEAPIGRVLAGTAQRQLKQGAPSGPHAASGSTRGRLHPGPRSPDSRAGFMRIKAPGRAVQRMEWVNNPVYEPPQWVNNPLYEPPPWVNNPLYEPQSHKMFEFHEAKIKGQIFDQGILNLNCGRYCATSAIEFWFPGITEEELKELLPTPKSSVLGWHYGWSPGKEGAQCFKEIKTLPETLEQWLEQLKKWGPLIVAGDFANVLNMGHVGHFVLVIGVIFPTAEQEGKIIVQDSFTTSSGGARIEWRFSKFKKTVESAYRVDKAMIEGRFDLRRRELTQ
jgi:ribosomal protein S18 acetylase RimI-like enzyme